MLKSTTILLMLFLVAANSCTSVERSAICSEIHNQEIAPIEMCDINFKFARCRCRQFDINKWVELSKPENHPLEYCDKISGFRLDAAAVEIGPKIKAMSRLKENLCQ